MRGLPIVLLLCLVTAVAGGTFLLGTDDVGPPPTPVAPPAVADEPPPTPVAPATAPVEEGSEANAEGAADAGAAVEADVERSTAAPAEAAAEGPTVRVVRGTPPVPVAGADVYFLTREEGNKRQGTGKHVPEFCWPEPWGQRVRTGDDGSAALPATRAPWLVAARSGDEFGFAVVPPPPRTVTLVLQADEALVLATRRADQAPVAAIPVAVLQQLANEDPRTLWSGETDGDGRTTVEHFQLVRQRLQDPAAKEQKPETFAAVAAVASTPPVVTMFVGRPVQHEPVVLLMPPLAGIEVLLTDHRGTPLLSPASVTGIAEPAPEAPGPLRLPPGVVQQRAAKPVGDAPVVLTHFGLGQSVRLFARFEGDRRGTSLLVPGPERDGARVLRQLPLAPYHVLLAGRLLLRNGAPLASAQLAGSLWRSDRDIGRPTVRTIADGRFDLVLTARNDAPPLWLEVRHTVAPSTPGDRPTQLGARIQLPRLDGGQRIELGDVVFDELPPLATGVVVDDRGEVVANADVRVQQMQPGNRPNEPESWRDLPHHATRTGDDGTFEFQGPLPPGTLRIRADSDLHFADSVPLTAAGQSVRIRIERNGIVRGRVLLPDWVADGTVSITMRPLDEAARERDTRRVDLSRRRGGRFTIEPLRAGRYDAILALRNLAEPLLVVADVFVEPGEVDDPRLREIDLRQALFRWRLRAVDARGLAFPVDGPILMHTQNQQGATVDAAFRWRGGRAEIISGTGLADLQFFGRGIQPMRLTLAAGDHDVYLQQLRPALLCLPGARALCGPRRKVRVSVVLTEGTGLPESLAGIDQRTGEQFGFARWDLGKSSGAWLEASDTVEVPLMKSGKYDVVLRVHANESERSPQASLALGAFDLVADSAAPATITVPLDTLALQQMLSGLDERARQAEQPKRR